MLLVSSQSQDVVVSPTIVAFSETRQRPFSLGQLENQDETLSFICTFATRALVSCVSRQWRNELMKLWSDQLFVALSQTGHPL